MVRPLSSGFSGSVEPPGIVGQARNVGLFTVTATVKDAAGLRTTLTDTLVVGLLNDPHAPTVAIVSPLNPDRITDPPPITGTASDAALWW